MADVVKIDDCAKGFCLPVFSERSVVGGEHDLFSAHAYSLCQLKLRHGAAVCAKSFLFPEELHDKRVGCRLDGKIFPEAREYAECLLESPCIPQHGALIIEMERGRIGTGN